MRKGFISFSMLLLISIMFASVLVADVGYSKEQVTVEWKYWEDVSDPNGYWRIWVTYSDDSRVQYDGWCADHSITLPRSGSTDVWLYDSVDEWGEMPGNIKDDEEWDVVNYIFSEWPTSDSGSVFYGATWKDIQQVVWMYTDNYNPASEDKQHPPKADSWVKVGQIKGHIDGLLPSIPSGGAMKAMVLDFNNDNPLCICSPKQLMFFVVPEIALGTLGAMATMIGALFAKTRLGRRNK